MKKIGAIFYAGMLLIAGCSSISVTRDEINDKSLIKMKIGNTPNDYSLAGYVETEFMREVDKNTYGPIQMKLTIHPMRDFQVFDSILNLKIDDRVYKLPMRSLTSDILSTLAGAGGASAINLGSGIGRSSLEPVAQLTRDMEKEMLGAKSIMYSLTSGTEFAMIKFTGGDMESIREFISYRVVEPSR
jgi:hypothetical protein